jgi:adenosylmethionine-8-amino-7-oxononanoate aminotransferase
VVDVRVKGAMGAVQVADDRHRDWMRHRFVDHGVWIRPLGDVVYVTPPLVMEPDDLSRLTDAMGRVIAEAYG